MASAIKNRRSEMSALLEDIRDQPRALRASAAAFSEAAQVGRELRQFSHPPVLSGMATSLYAWHSAALVMAQHGQASFVLDAGELALRTAAFGANPIIVTSRSGASAEVARLCRTLPEEQYVVAITERRESPLGRRAQKVLAFSAEEGAFQNTKSFTLSLAYSLALAAGHCEDRRLLPKEWIDKVADAIERITSEYGGFDPNVVRTVCDARIVLVVARRHLIGVLRQAALDLQEGARIGAIPVPGTLLRHGPLELALAPDVAVLLLIDDDEDLELNLNALKELDRIGTETIVLAVDDVPLPRDRVAIRIPRLERELAPFTFSVALQLLNHDVLQRLRRADSKPELIDKVTLIE